MWKSAVYENLLSEFWHAPPARELVQPYYFQTNERLPQYRTEEVLRRRMAEAVGVELVRVDGDQMSGQDAGGVRVVIEQDGVRGPRGRLRRRLRRRALPGAGAGRHRAQRLVDELVALVVFRSAELHEALTLPGPVHLA